MYVVYVIKSLKDNRTYVGYSSNIDKRLEQHNKGLVKSTRNRTPFKLWYKETCLSRAEAMRRERYFKSHSGRNRLKDILSKL